MGATEVLGPERVEIERYARIAGRALLVELTPIQTALGFDSHPLKVRATHRNESFRRDDEIWLLALWHCCEGLEEIVLDDF